MLLYLVFEAYGDYEATVTEIFFSRDKAEDYVAQQNEATPSEPFYFVEWQTADVG